MPSALTVAELALRAAARAGTGDWLVLVVPEAFVAVVPGEVKAELEGFGAWQVEWIRDVTEAGELARRFQEAVRERVLLLSGVQGFSQVEWKHLDMLRSRLMRERPVILVISPGALAEMARNCPNLTSWIGGSVWEIDTTTERLSPEEKEARLEALREWSGLADEEVIRRAEEGTLPKEPEFAEWLVLLGRVELIER